MSRLLICCGTLLAASLLAASPEYENAHDLYQHTDYKQAIAILEKIPNPDAATLLLLGRAHFAAKSYEKATETLQKGAQKAPKDAAIHGWLGRAWGMRANTASAWNLKRASYATQARDAWQKALELDPNNHDSLDDLSEYYIQAPGFMGGGIDKAETLAKRIASIDPAWGQRAYARIKEHREDFTAAESHLRKAVELAPKKAAQLVDLASFLARRGRHNESDVQFAEAMKLAPNDPDALFARASTLVEHQRNPGEARQLLNQYLALNLTPENPSRAEAQELLRKIAR